VPSVSPISLGEARRVVSIELYAVVALSPGPSLATDFASPCCAVRERVSRKAIEMQRQGFSGSAMLPWSELQYTGIAEQLDKRFASRLSGTARTG
jgi:hypothetical protein